jgi:hypothetical protein
MRALLVLFLAIISLPAAAMEFSRSHNRDFSIIFATGKLLSGDGARFVSFATDDKAIVVLESPGGDVFSALTMGEHIRMKGYKTFVASESICASACALVWLAGSVRGGTETSKIGFHSASDSAGAITGPGNALVGAYLNKIGVSYKAIAYITSSAPKDMTWLTFDRARNLGLDIVAIDDPGSNEPIGLGGRPSRPSAPSTAPSAPSSLIPEDFQLTCEPLARGGRDPVVSIEVSRTDGFWRVVHETASGVEYDRGTQYRMSAEQSGAVWVGQHRRKEDTAIRGEVSRISGKFYYNEKVIGDGDLRADMTAKCEAE